ncbi:uncharacterized protein ACMZJ9_005491 [Mantella aurantiaca]
MTAILKNYHRLHDHMILTDHPAGNHWTHQVAFKKRQIPQLSSRLICSLWALCIALLFIITVILIVTVTGQMEQKIEVGLRNLSLGMHSRVERLSQDDNKSSEKLNTIETSMRDLKGLLSRDSQKVLEEVDKLPEKVQKGIDSKLTEKLSAMETSTKNLKGQQLHQMEQNMEVKLRNLSVEIFSKVDQLCQDDSRIMEKLSTMEASMTDIKDQQLYKMEQNMGEKLGNLSMEMHSAVVRLSQEDSKMIERLSAIETSTKNLNGQCLYQLEKNMEVKLRNLSMEMNSVVEQVTQNDSRMMEKLSNMESSMKDLKDSRMMEKLSTMETSMKTLTGSLSRDIQKVLISVQKLPEEIRKGKGSGELCPTGWMNFDGSCYFWSSNMRPWNSAKKECEDRNAHLVVVNGNQEMIYLRAFSEKKMWWLGLTEREDTWEWVDGTSYEMTPQFWQAGQPDDYANRGLRGGEDCAQLRDADGWNDAHCSSKHLYVCEKRIS